MAFLEDLRYCDSPRASPLVGWLSPRISFSSSVADLHKEAVIDGGDYDSVCTDFEFSMTMADLDSVSADELFSNGKLLPLHLSAEFVTIQTDSVATAQKQDPGNPKTSEIQEADAEQKLFSDLNHPPVAAAEGRLFAPPSPETPKCSIMLRDLFGVNKPQVGAIRDAPGKLLATAKLWKHLVRGVIASGKRGALRSSVLEENAKVSAGSHANASKMKPLAASSASSQISSSHLLSAKQQQIPPQSSRHLNPSMRILTKSAGGAASADDSNIFLTRKKAFSGRSISMPSSRCSSPTRESAKSTTHTHTHTHKPLSGGSERSSATSSGRVNSGKIIMKNLERCSTNQKFPPRVYDQSSNGIQHREYWRSGEKVNSYSSNVRVTPVLTVPLSLAPSGISNKLAKGRFSSFKELFSPKKEAQL